jgi:carboxymethylenebutenolidase
MASNWTTLEVDNDAMRVYVSTPTAGGPAPGVVVIQHAGGVDTFIQTMCDRLAGAGYVAAAPDLFHRQKDKILEEVAALPAGSPDRLPKLMTKLGQFKDSEVVRDVDAVVDMLAAHETVAGQPVGITGFCMGGRVAYLMAAKNSKIAASGIFYGAMLTSSWGDEGGSPMDLTADVNCPVIGFFGNDDQNPSPEVVAQLDALLTEHGKEHAFHSYEGAEHAFMDFSNANSHREGPAADAWPKLIAFFDEKLKAPVATGG